MTHYQIKRPTLAVALVIPFITCIISISGATDDQDLSMMVAEVNGEPIYAQEINLAKERYSTVLDLETQVLGLVGQIKAESDILDNLIDRKLLIQEAKKKEISVHQSAVNTKLARFKKQYDNVEDYHSALVSLNISEQQIKQLIKNGLLIQLLLDQELFQKIRIKEDEILRYYEENSVDFEKPEHIRLSHIVIKTNQDSDEFEKFGAYEKIQEINERVKNGEEFALLAMEYSEDENRSNAGDLGYINRNSLIPEISDVAFTLEPGETSHIIESQYGYHLIKVTEKIPPKILPFRSVKSIIKDRLKFQKQQKATRRYIKSLRRQASIEKYLY